MPTLSTLDVVFKAVGLDQLKTTLDKLNLDLTQVGKVTTTSGDLANKQFVILDKSVKTLGFDLQTTTKQATVGFTGLTAAVTAVGPPALVTTAKIGAAFTGLSTQVGATGKSAQVLGTQLQTALTGVPAALARIKPPALSIPVAATGLEHVQTDLAGLKPRPIAVPVVTTGLPQAQAAVDAIKPHVVTVPVVAAGVAHVQGALDALKSKTLIVAVSVPTGGAQAALDSLKTRPLTVDVSAATSRAQVAIDTIQVKPLVVDVSANVARAQETLGALKTQPLALDVSPALGAVQVLQSRVLDLKSKNVHVSVLGQGVVEVQKSLDALKPPDVKVPVHEQGATAIQATLNNLHAQEVKVPVAAVGLDQLTNALEELHGKLSTAPISVNLKLVTENFDHLAPMLNQATTAALALGQAVQQAGSSGFWHLAGDVLAVGAAATASAGQARAAGQQLQGAFAGAKPAVDSITAAVLALEKELAQQPAAVAPAGMALTRLGQQGVQAAQAAATAFKAKLSQIQADLGALKPHAVTVPVVATGLTTLQKALDELKRGPVPVPVIAAGLKALQMALDTLKPHTVSIPVVAAGLEQARTAINAIQAKPVIVPVTAAIGPAQATLDALEPKPLTVTVLAAVEPAQAALNTLAVKPLVVPVAADVAGAQTDIDAIEVPALEVPVTAPGVFQVQEELTTLAAPALVVPVTAPGVFQIQEELDTFQIATLEVPVTADIHQVQVELADLHVVPLHVPVSADVFKVQEELDHLQVVPLVVPVTSPDVYKVQGALDALGNAATRAGTAMAAAAGGAASSAWAGLPLELAAAGAAVATLGPEVLTASQKVEVLKNAMIALSQVKAENAAAAAKATGDAIGEVSNRGAMLALKLGAAIGYLTGQVMSFARSGLAASAAGDVLNMQFQRLGLAVAGLFGPEIEAVSKAVEKLTNWLAGLSDSARSSLAHFLMMGISMGSMAGIMAVVTRAIGGLVSAIRVMTVAFTQGLVAAGGMMALLPGIGLIVSLLGSMLLTSESGRDALGKLGEALAPIAVAVAHLAELVAPLLEVLAIGIGWLADHIVMVLAVAGTAFLVVAIKVGVLTKAIRLLWTTTLGWVGIILIAAEALYHLFGMEKKGKDDRSSLAQKSSGFAAIESHYEEIARRSVAVGMGKDVQEKQLSELEQINKNTGRPHPKPDSPFERS